MARKRADSTVYLGEKLIAALKAYRDQYPLPPTASAVVREAVSRYLAEEEPTPARTPAEWVRLTQPLVDQLRDRGVSVSTATILQALDDAEEERIRAILGEPS